MKKIQTFRSGHQSHLRKNVPCICRVALERKKVEKMKGKEGFFGVSVWRVL